MGKAGYIIGLVFGIILLTPAVVVDAQVQNLKQNQTQTQTRTLIQILKILSQNIFIDNNPYAPRLHIVGEVQDNGSQLVEGIAVSATLYDRNNQVVGVGNTYTNPGMIRPGQTTPFEIVID
jgi:hypothetical protein